jgi:hypothetical protein
MTNPFPSTAARGAAAALLLAAAALASSPAQAQQIGTYLGTTSEGGEISVYVGLDGAGVLSYVGNSTDWAVTCKSGDIKHFYWHTFADHPLSGNKATDELAIDILYTKLTMTFNGDQVKGTFFGSGPTFTDVTSSTKQVEYCSSNKLTYTATYVPGSAAAIRHGAAAGTAMRISR